MQNKIFNRVKAYLFYSQYTPSLLGIFINPFYFARRAIYKNIKSFSGHITGIILDIGCGSKPYKGLFTADQYIGMDIRISGHHHVNSLIDVFYDGSNIPFGNNHFDSIVCFEVLEHVFNPKFF